MSPVLSIVVPMFDVEHYISPCLESLVNQRLADLEIIVVDDGSTDASRAIAEQWAENDSRICVLGQPNAGVSAARSAGVRAAQGRYLAFCDSDDIVPATAYTSLVESLETTGSDFASGNACRLDSSGAQPDSIYRDVFAHSRRRTHILRHPPLVRDCMVWNKVFRRSFWDARDLVFTLPEYEDGPVMMRAHIEASAVDMLSEVVYFWRIRERGAPSITQRRSEPANMAARMRMVLDTFKVIAALAAELIPAYVNEMCLRDVREALSALHLHDDATMSDVLSLTRSFVMGVPADLLDSLPPADRRLMAHLVRGEFTQIRQLMSR
jgi:glycosyltransferase involved in cell wall biosynthesis